MSQYCHCSFTTLCDLAVISLLELFIIIVYYTIRSISIISMQIITVIVYTFIVSPSRGQHC